MSDDNKKYARQLRELFFTLSVTSDRTSYDTKAAIERFHRHVALTESAVKREVRTAVSVPLWKHFMRVAAVIILLICSIVAYFLGNRHVEQQFAQITMEAPEGSQLNLNLPDGTKVKLNSGSELRYSQGYGIVDRNVFLAGEGYFEVSHRDDMQFVVTTNDLVLKDLGTEFNIRNYDEDEEASVSLIDGSVEVTSLQESASTIVLKRGEGLSLNKRTGVMCKMDGDSAEDVSWQMDELNFIDMSISDIARQLSRSYGVTIEVMPSVRDRRFYGFFNRREDTLNKILEVISNTDLIKYRREKDKYVIY